MRCAALGLLLALAVSPALADPVCGKLAFPLDHERALLNAPGTAVRSGEILGVLPDQALALVLKPTGDAKLPYGAAKPGDPAKFAGYFRLTPPMAGDYLVSLSSEGWIDVFQDGAEVTSTAHTGDPDCPGLRKSVRFTLSARPVTVEISNAPAAGIAVAVTPVR